MEVVNKNLGHLMIDLETLGTKSNSVICSIGAVEFNLDTYEIGKIFYEKIDIDSSLDNGMVVDGGSIKFWLTQNDDARNELLTNTKNIKEVLYLFRKYIETLGVNELKVWGNGTRFDLGLIHDAYRLTKSGIIPWSIKNERDVRTYMMDHLEIKQNLVFEGTKHNPIDDCLHQIKYLHQCFKVKNKIM